MVITISTQSASQRRGEGLQPTRIWRDLTQIAELVELCFEGRLDAQGRSAINEMKSLGMMGILLWPLSLLDRAGLGIGMGYVWRDEGRVVGNVSLYRAGRHPELGPGWLIANVSTHPNFRREGIARKLMDATIDLARYFRGKWISLQVESNNTGALNLYDRLGFARYETLEQWEAGYMRNLPAPPDLSTAGWIIRLRGGDEIRQEYDLIYDRARRGAMVWTRPIEPGDLSDLGFNMLGTLPGGRSQERWVIQRADQPDRFYGAIWVKSSSFSRATLTAFFDPVLDEDVQVGFLWTVLDRNALLGRRVRLETTNAGEWMETTLREAGFRRLRALVQMRLILT